MAFREIDSHGEHRGAGACFQGRNGKYDGRIRPWLTRNTNSAQLMRLKVSAATTTRAKADLEARTKLSGDGTQCTAAVLQIEWKPGLFWVLQYICERADWPGPPGRSAPPEVAVQSGKADTRG